jgi:glucosylglycerate phosphorylase
MDNSALPHPLIPGILPGMKSDFEQLQWLYGSSKTRLLLERIEDLINRYAPAIPRQLKAKRRPLPLSEKDAVLITYGDQVQSPGERPLSVLNSFLEAHLAGMINSVHLLPFYPYSSDDGFSVIDYKEVNPALGDWREIDQMASRFDLMFDGVFNHISSASEWFRRFLADDQDYRDFFIVVEGDPDLSQVVRPRTLPLLTTFATGSGPKKVWTTFSPDQVDLNFANPEVLLAVLDTLLFYAARGARFIRLDAIAYLWKEPGTSCIHLPQTHALIQLMRETLDQVAPGSLLVTETNVAHPENLSYFGDGENEAQLVYNFALPPLVLHAFANQDARILSRWAAGLNLPSRDVTFFNFLASHDGIGVNPARGILPESEIERLAARALEHGGYVSYKSNADGGKSPYELNITFFDALSNPDGEEPLELQVNRFMAAQAIMLSLKGLPGIYFHSLFGSRNDRQGAESSGIPRRINRQKLTLEPLLQEMQTAGSIRAMIFSRCARLLKTRQSHPAFHPLAEQKIIRLDHRVFAVERSAPQGGNPILCLHNVSAEPVRLAFETRHNHYTPILPGHPAPVREGMLDLMLSPYEAWWAAAWK